MSTGMRQGRAMYDKERIDEGGFGGGFGGGGLGGGFGGGLGEGGLGGGKGLGRREVRPPAAHRAEAFLLNVLWRAVDAVTAVVPEVGQRRDIAKLLGKRLQLEAGTGIKAARDGRRRLQKEGSAERVRESEKRKGAGATHWTSSDLSLRQLRAISLMSVQAT